MAASNELKMFVVPTSFISDRWQPLQPFLYLHLLDVLTTLVGLRLGCAEQNPFVNLLIGYGPVFGLLISKTAVIGAAVLWIRSGRNYRAIWILNYGFAAVVVWNLCVLFTKASELRVLLQAATAQV